MEESKFGANQGIVVFEIAIVGMEMRVSSFGKFIALMRQGVDLGWDLGWMDLDRYSGIAISMLSDNMGIGMRWMLSV